MYYGGLDVHTQYVTIALVDKSGRIVLETSVSTREPDRLLAELAPWRPLTVVVEACGLWPWLHDLLVPAGITFKLAHAKHLRAIAENAQKTDRVDATLLARMLLADLIPPAFPKSAVQLERMRLVRHRTGLVRERTRLVNRIHGQLHQRNIVLARERLLRQDTREWLFTSAWPELAPEQQAVLETHFALIEHLSELLRPLDRRIEQLARSEPAAVLLQTIPGIGPFWALLLTTELLPVARFRRPAHLVSYAGLAPRTRSSGGQTRHGRIPAGANRWVRWALISAIPSHLRHAPGSALSQYYTQLTARLGWPTARVAAARKLARLVHHMLRTATPWAATQAGRDALREATVA
jgi:transposase